MISVTYLSVSSLKEKNTIYIGRKQKEKKTFVILKNIILLRTPHKKKIKIFFDYFVYGKVL